MTSTPFKRFTAAAVASTLTVFGPGLSGYTAAAQMRALPVTPVAPISAPLNVAPIENLAPLSNVDLGGVALTSETSLSMESLALTPAAAARVAPAARTETRREMVRSLGRTLGKSRRIASMAHGAAYGVGRELEAAMTRQRVRGASDVEVSETAALELDRPAAAPARVVALNAAPEELGPQGATRFEAATFVQRVYSWMAVGLGVTAGAAALMIANPASVAALAGSTPMMIGLIVAELGLVFALTLAAPKLSTGAALGMFLTYAALNGVTMSVVLALVAKATVLSAFMTTAGMFAGLAAFGHFTKKNLSGIGAAAGMALWGLILASVVNMFMHNTGLDALITYAGVAIFSILTAADAQKIKELGQSGYEKGKGGQNLAIIGALIMYLDFINMFWYILKLYMKAQSKK